MLLTVLLLGRESEVRRRKRNPHSTLLLFLAYLDNYQVRIRHVQGRPILGELHF